MKSEFIGFYEPTKKEIDAAWGGGTFAFDANCLLNLYRYTEVTRKDFIASLKAINEKLFLPYQAAFEYHSNRNSVIEGIDNSYVDLLNIFETNFEKTLIAQINQFKKHPTISVENITKLHSEFLSKISAELDMQKKNHPGFKKEDSVLNELSSLFENKIGKKFSSDELKKIYAEGKDRYAESIPPGYKDLETKKRRGEAHVYGDLIIWKELINQVKKEKKPLIFVTDDRKEDWWTIENGKTIRPREELIKEFYDLTGIRVLIYNAESFLRFAKEQKLVPEINEKTIEEIKEVRVSDEKSKYATNFWLTDIDYLTNSDMVKVSNMIKKDNANKPKKSAFMDFFEREILDNPKETTLLDLAIRLKDSPEFQNFRINKEKKSADNIFGSEQEKKSTSKKEDSDENNGGLNLE